jgi:opacity protein-like surface antigen
MRWALSCLAAFGLASAAMAADEDKDLELIPRTEPAAKVPVAPQPAGQSARIYIENALTLNTLRNDLLVPAPPPLAPHWEERLLGDVRAEWSLAPNMLVAYSGRLNLLAADGLGFPNAGNVTHDLRELHLSVEPRPRDYFDLGRINVKSGVALGFNPTDFFKARAVVDPLTADPSVLRENRLGTLMVRGQHVGEGGSISLVYAPKVTSAAAIGNDPDRGFSPLFGRTNASERWLVKASARLHDDFNPELLFYHENGRTKVGVNLTESIGQSTVAYVEWAGGRSLGIIDQALAFGRQTGTIPAFAPDVIDQGGQERFRSQAAIGASYTTENKITFNLEYHYNGAGLSGTDWSRWFAAGEGRPASSPITQQLWFIRSYAAEFQEPLQRHAVFLRADWVDFLVPKLELTGFVLADAADGSTLLQLEANYARTDLWSFGVLAAGTTGGRRSNFGSLPRAGSVLFKVIRYF